jgi:hypothetical protein
MRAMNVATTRWLRAAPRSWLLVALFVVGCKRHTEDAPAPAPSASVTAVDRLLPGELVPGDKKAFWILLPRDVKIDQALLDVVFASGPVSPSDLANYIQARVRDGTVSIGATSTIFDQVKPLDDPAHTLFIRIFPGPGGRGARMEVRNVTQRPIPEGGTEEERWKEFGLRPDGRLLDPKHLH